MRQILFTIPTDLTIPVGGWQIPVFGMGILLCAWVAFVAFRCWQEVARKGDVIGTGLFGLLVATGIVLLPRYVAALPLYGYGMMLVCGLLAGVWLAGVRLRREGCRRNWRRTWASGS